MNCSKTIMTPDMISTTNFTLEKILVSHPTRRDLPTLAGRSKIWVRGRGEGPSPTRAPDHIFLQKGGPPRGDHQKFIYSVNWAKNSFLAS